MKPIRIGIPFWDKWLPLLDWGCKCGVQQRRNDAEAKQPPDDIKQPPADMLNNPGKTGEIITAGHPMFLKMGEQKKQQVDKQIKFLNLNIERKRFLNNTSREPIALPDGKQAKLSKRAIKKTLHDCGMKEFAIFKDLNSLTKNATYKEARKPTGDNVNIRHAHFYKLKTSKELYALIWETTGNEFLFHSITYKITGKKIDANK